MCVRVCVSEWKFPRELRMLALLLLLLLSVVCCLAAAGWLRQCQSPGIGQSRCRLPREIHGNGFSVFCAFYTESERARERDRERKKEQSQSSLQNFFFSLYTLGKFYARYAVCKCMCVCVTVHACACVLLFTSVCVCVCKFVCGAVFGGFEPVCQLPPHMCIGFIVNFICYHCCCIWMCVSVCVSMFVWVCCYLHWHNLKLY